MLQEEFNMLEYILVFFKLVFNDVEFKYGNDVCYFNVIFEFGIKYFVIIDKSWVQK